MFDKTKTLAIGCDHAGYELKEFIKKNVISLGQNRKDFGTYSEESVDYPDFIHPLAKSIDEGEIEMGIIMCGSGNGVSMVANKYKKVRCAMAWNTELASMARQHNDANIICLRARKSNFNKEIGLVRLFLKTKFSKQARHKKRIKKLG